ncbi:MAG: FtsQ-type POTRA domain-containing protein [Coriobacteriia bacterium]|nr:FtsQ-type POTRA domain-containing protein [Coriobacteriia bacterium]
MRVSFDKKKAPEIELERRHPSRNRTAFSSGQAGAPRSRATERLVNAKRKERKKRQRKARMKNVGIGIAVVLIVCLLCWGLIALYRAPIFYVQSVEVSGAKHYTPDEVRRMADIPADVSLFTLSAGVVAKRLETDPWVVSAEVDRSFPKTVRIAIKERVAVGAVDVGEDSRWLVSSDGHWLGEPMPMDDATSSTEASAAGSVEGAKGAEASKEASDTPPVRIIDVPAVSPEIGEPVKEQEIQNAIGVINGLTPKLLSTVAIVSAPSVDETALRTTEDLEIFIGEAVSMQVKCRIIDEILSANASVVYINVRVIDRPTWRGLRR